MRPYLPVRGIIGGAMIGLAAVVLLQQFAVLYPTRGVTAMAIVGAVVIVLVLANLIRASARPKVVAAAAPVAPAAAPAPAADAFPATHRVPATGADAYDAPGAATPTNRLDPGLDVQVLERSGDWAHVRCSNGWETWVDARVLTPV